MSGVPLSPSRSSVGTTSKIAIDHEDGRERQAEQPGIDEEQQPRRGGLQVLDAETHEEHEAERGKHEHPLQRAAENWLHP